MTMTSYVVCRYKGISTFPDQATSKVIKTLIIFSKLKGQGPLKLKKMSSGSMASQNKLCDTSFAHQLSLDSPFKI
jgi:hypothetical protein